MSSETDELDVLMDNIDAEVRAKMDLSDERLADVAELATLSLDDVRTILSEDNVSEFAWSRAFELQMKRLTPQQAELFYVDCGATLPSIGYGWNGDPIDVARKNGRPRHYGVERLWFILEAWWKASGNKRPWSPVFVNDDEPKQSGKKKKRKLCEAINPQARLFLAIAQTLDPAYDAAACNAAVSAAKDARRTPEQLEKRKATAAKRAEKWRANRPRKRK